MTPSNGNFFAGVQLVVLQASSSDAEDGQLADGSLAWSSDTDGFLGVGRTFEVLASDVTENDHTITLTGTDSGGAAALETVAITIYRTAPTPPTSSPSTSPSVPPTTSPSVSPSGNPSASPSRSLASPSSRPIPVLRPLQWNLQLRVQKMSVTSASSISCASFSPSLNG